MLCDATACFNGRTTARCSLSLSLCGRRYLGKRRNERGKAAAASRSWGKPNADSALERSRSLALLDLSAAAESPSSRSARNLRQTVWRCQVDPFAADQSVCFPSSEQPISCSSAPPILSRARVREPDEDPGKDSSVRPGPKRTLCLAIPGKATCTLFEAEAITSFRQPLSDTSPQTHPLTAETRQTTTTSLAAGETVDDSSDRTDRQQCKPSAALPRQNQAGEWRFQPAATAPFFPALSITTPIIVCRRRQRRCRHERDC